MFDGDDFSWDEFYYRYVTNHEEFRFLFYDKIIDLSFALDKNKELIVALSFGNDKEGYIWKDYKNTDELLIDNIFNGKTLKDIWHELK